MYGTRWLLARLLTPLPAGPPTDPPHDKALSGHRQLVGTHCSCPTPKIGGHTKVSGHT